MKFFLQELVVLCCCSCAFNYIGATKTTSKGNGSIFIDDNKKNSESLFAAATTRRRPAVERAIRTRRSDLADRSKSYNKRTKRNINRKVQADESKGIGHIVHGRDAKIGEAPFVVKLLLSCFNGIKGCATCTGSLLAPNVVLTAEHCFPFSSQRAFLDNRQKKKFEQFIQKIICGKPSWGIEGDCRN